MQFVSHICYEHSSWLSQWEDHVVMLFHHLCSHPILNGSSSFRRPTPEVVISRDSRESTSRLTRLDGNATCLRIGPLHARPMWAYDVSNDTSSGWHAKFWKCFKYGEITKCQIVLIQAPRLSLRLKGKALGVQFAMVALICNLVPEIVLYVGACIHYSDKAKLF